MKYTKEIIKKMIDEFLQSHSILQVTNFFRFRYKKDEDFKAFIDDPNTTFGDKLAQRLYNIYYNISEWPKCEYEKCNNKSN